MYLEKKANHTDFLGLLQPPLSAPQLSTTPRPLLPPLRPLQPPHNQCTATNPPKLPPTPRSPLKTAMAILSLNTASQRTRTRTKCARASSLARSSIITCRRIRQGTLKAILKRNSRMVLAETKSNSDTKKCCSDCAVARSLVLCTNTTRHNFPHTT